MCDAKTPGVGARLTTPSGVVYYPNTPAGHAAHTADMKAAGGGGDKEMPPDNAPPPEDLTDCTAYTDDKWDTGCSKFYRFSHMKYRPKDGEGTVPAVQIACNWQKLCQQVIDPLREQFPALHINSGYRTIAYDKTLGGGYGDHTAGRAADLSLGGPEGAKAIFKFIRANNLPYSQIIFEGNWTHVALGGSSNAASAVGVARTGAAPYQWYTKNGNIPSDLA
jgi:hypothetical protein